MGRIAQWFTKSAPGSNPVRAQQLWGSTTFQVRRKNLLIYVMKSGICCWKKNESNMVKSKKLKLI